MNIKMSFIFPILLFLISISGNCEESLSFESYISLISNKLPDIKINLINLEKASNTYVQSRSIEDTYLNANSELFGTGATSNSSTISVDSVSGSLLGIEISKKILDVGTTLAIGFSYQNTLTRAHSLPGNSTSVDYTTISPNLTLSVSQPLLKNSFGMIDRFSITDARLVRDIQSIQTELDNMNILTSYSKIFFQWIGQLKALLFLSNCINSAAKSEKLLRDQLSAGLIENDDYQSTKNLYLQYISSYLTYEQALKSIIIQLGYYFDTKNVIPNQKEWDIFLSNVIQSN